MARLLRPGGRLFIREAHPVLWALDEPGTYVATAEGLFAADPDGEWRLTDRPERLPATYTLQAVKR